jgi:uncharacterized protein
MEEKLRKIREIVEDEMSCLAHDMDHVMRVYETCLVLAKDEPGIDLDVLRAAALLHDIARAEEYRDRMGRIDHAALGAEKATRVLKELGYPEEKIERIRHCIITHRFRGDNPPETMEAKILFDADKLDMVGAVGVARSFMVAGQYGQSIYSEASMDEYLRENIVSGMPGGRIKDISRHTPNIEYKIKLRHVPTKIQTERAKELIRERSAFMDEFFERLRREIIGEN